MQTFVKIFRAPVSEGPGMGAGGGGTAIRHTPAPSFGAGAAPVREAAPGGTPAGLAPEPPKHKIMHISQGLVGGMSTNSESRWQRKPAATGSGACHVKSFHCKLASESMEMLDQQINEWLDAHPDYEVKLVTTTVGEWQGKTKEPSLIVQVWV